MLVVALMVAGMTACCAALLLGAFALVRGRRPDVLDEVDSFARAHAVTTAWSRSRSLGRPAGPGDATG